MKILQSSLFRAICAIAIGILLIKYPDNTVTWMTVAIGVLFLLSGIISVIVYVNARKHVAEYKITDAEGNTVVGTDKPTFPIVGVGSIILGAMLRTDQDERRRKLGSDLLVCGCLPTVGAGILIGGILLFSKDEQKKTVGKKCIAAAFISLMLCLFLMSGGFRI